MAKKVVILGEVVGGATATASMLAFAEESDMSLFNIGPVHLT
jgi:hypothetical protein